MLHFIISKETTMYFRKALSTLALVWLFAAFAQAATELKGVIGKELVGQDAVPPEYHGLWGKDGNCRELEQPFFMHAVFVTKKAIAFDKQSCPINASLEDGGAFKAAFNCITVGENKLQTLPVRLVLRDAKLYVTVGDEPEDGPYLNCNAPGFGASR